MSSKDRKPALFRVGHGVALVVTSYFLIATGAQPVPPARCFDDFEDGGSYDVALVTQLSGTSSTTESGGIVSHGSGGGRNNGGAGGESGEEKGLLPQNGCAGLDGLDRGKTIRLRLEDASEEQKDSGGGGCLSYRAKLLSPLSSLLIANFDEEAPEPDDYLTMLRADLRMDPDSPCGGVWSLEVYPAFDTPSSENPLEPGGEYRVTRTIIFPQVHFCEGLLDSSVRGEFSCSDTWNVTIRKAK